jgi:hypothetical protein
VGLWIQQGATVSAFALQVTKCPFSPISIYTWRIVESRSRAQPTSPRPPFRSAMLAGCTTACMNEPSASTRRCRVCSFFCLASSSPRIPLYCRLCRLGIEDQLQRNPGTTGGALHGERHRCAPMSHRGPITEKSGRRSGTVTGHGQQSPGGSAPEYEPHGADQLALVMPSWLAAGLRRGITRRADCPLRSVAARRKRWWDMGNLLSAAPPAPFPPLHSPCQARSGSRWS